MKKNSRLFPDVEADRRYFEALKKGDWELWRNSKLDQFEDGGQHELLNWFCRAGALSELGHQKADHAVFLESRVTHSDKVFAVCRPQ